MRWGEVEILEDECVYFPEGGPVYWDVDTPEIFITIIRELSVESKVFYIDFTSQAYNHFKNKLYIIYIDEM